MVGGDEFGDVEPELLICFQASVVLLRNEKDHFFHGF
jgi:hypothetical protein